MNEADAIGGIVTGGLAARAVEPHTGEGDRSDDGGSEGGGEGACLNCSVRLVGDYCHACGQHGHVHRTLGAFWHDLLHGVLHFEGKIWRTLPLLAWRPGELTRRYIAGERAKFVSPMAFFLFSVFVMFAAMSLLFGSFHTNGVKVAPGEAIGKAQQRLKSDLADLERGRKSVVEAGGEATALAAIDADIEEAKAELAQIDQASQFVKVETDVTAGDSGLQSLGDLFKKAKENPDLLLYKLQTNAYKFSWALIPISVPLLWLLFLHRRRHRAYRAYDHTVFVTYSITFMSLLVILLSVLGKLGVGGGWIALAAFIVPPVHMYRQLRGAYSLGRFSAAWRTLILVNFAILAVNLFIAGIVYMGVSG